MTISILKLLEVFKQKGRDEVVQKSSSTSVTRRSDLEMQIFWAKELNDLIYLQLVEGKLPYPEINQHFADYNKHISARTGRSMTVSLSTNYHWSCKDAEGSAGINSKDGSVEIQLYVPAIMDLFEALERSNQPRWREAFKAHCIILFMHEMEHLRKDTPMKKHIDISEESRAWVETCRYTIAPLVEKYHLPLFLSDFNMYYSWNESAGNGDSQIWKNAILKLYGDLDGRTN